MVNGMKHTEIGDIPENWQVQTFEETFKLLPNNTLPRADLNNRGGSVRNVHYGDILVRFPEVLDCKTEDIPYLNDTALITANVQFLQDGDVLLADTAEDETVGKATEIYGLGDGKMVAGLHTIPCRVKKGDFAPKWLGYYMNSHAYHNQIMPYVTGIKVSSISKSAIAETLVLVPPKQEQEAIVAALSDIDTLIVNLEKLVAKYQMIKQGCLEKMFPRNGQNEPEIRLPGFSGAWEQRELRELCSEIGDGLHSAPIYDENGDYYFINGNNLFNGKIIIDTTETKRVSKETFMKNDKCLDDKTILLSINGTIGNLAYYSGEKVMLGKSASYLKAQNIVKEFLYTSLQTSIVMDIFMLSLTGTTIKNLELEAIKNTKIHTPNPKEQHQIGAFFTTLDRLITLHQRKLEKYKMIKQGMMSELLTGKTRLI